jgi:DNA-binding NtrC family response regulator
MAITTRTLLAFVDLKDPFMPSGIEGEEQLGPILSILAVQPFDWLFLFHTPHTNSNAEATCSEVRARHPRCEVRVHELSVTDPKNYSELMGRLAKRIRDIGSALQGKNFVCVSSGTPEMRAAWFLLTSTGILNAKLLQVGTSAQRLFGPASVREVQFDIGDWENLSNRAMPMKSFERPPIPLRPGRGDLRDLLRNEPLTSLPEETISTVVREVFGTDQLPTEHFVSFSAHPLLDKGLQELGIQIGSAIMREAAERAAIAALSDIPCLLLGETGTGKELFAKLIHRLSHRHSKPLIPVNCAAIPKELAESHLFGHVKGAFTGADKDQKGVFETAHDGTLFLDEIGELTPDVQAKLLRVLQDGELRPLGSTCPRKVNVRIVAATNRNLKQEVRTGRFREDLYFRLEVVQINLPPLRERRSEIAKLAIALLQQINQRMPRSRQLSKEALMRLEQYHWPGNVRELSNVIQRSVLYARTDTLGPEDLIIEESPASTDLFSTLPEPTNGFSVDTYLNKIRIQLFLRALAKSHGNQSVAAGLLGVTKQAVSKFVAGQVDNNG